MIDDQPLAGCADARAVIRVLAEGRSLAGEPSDPHDAHGWLAHGAETEALAAIVASSAWGLYTGSGRFRASAVAAFERDREVFLRWLEGCARGGRDLFFASFPLEGAPPPPIDPAHEPGEAQQGT